MPKVEIKIFMLTKELKWLAAFMTISRGWHDIQTVLCLAAHWPDLEPLTCQYTEHCMQLLNTVATNGWSAALCYYQQGAEKFLDVPSKYWTGYQP
jgi:hypothetical protein